MKSISKVAVLGAGVLGSQIAFQVAANGIDVILYDVDSESFGRASQIFGWMEQYYADRLNASPADIEAAYNRLSYAFELEEVMGAELIIESIPENLEMKKELYLQLAGLADNDTIFATNSSTFLPSQLMEYTGRPDRFLALHFANLLVQFNTAEVMGSPKTDPDVYATVVQFARDINMVPIEMRKEKDGYILNSLLIPLLSAAAELWMTGVADTETIDKTWKIATGAQAGPFEIFDIIGLNTMYNISMGGDMKSKLFAHFLKENYISKGKLGYLSGEGFYKYPREGGIL